MSDKQLTVYEFAQKVKAKYPEYNDIDDVELAQKIIAKYPEYENIVTFEEPKKKEEPIPSASSVGESVSPEETPEVKKHKKSFLDYLSETSPIGTGPLDLSEGRVLRDQPTLMEVLKENPEYGNKMVNRSVAAAKTGILLAEADAGLRSVDFEEIADIQKVIQQNQPKEGDFFYNKNDGFVGFMYDLGRTLPESFISMGAAAATPLTAASVGTGAAAGTVVPGVGTAVGAAGGFAFATSAINEYGTTIMAMLDEEGIDITDSEELKKAFANEELIGNIKSKAAKRAGVIGLIDGISGGVAGKVSKKIVGEVGEEIIEQLAKGTAEEVIEQSSKAGRKILYKDVVETTVESLAGGTGEALGSLAAGQEISLRDVLLETLADPTSKIVSTGGSKAQSFMDGVSKNLEGSGNITEAQKSLLKLAKKDPKRFQDIVAASQYRNAGQIKQINAKIASLKESSEFGKDKSIDKLIGQLQRRKANLQMRTMSELRGADEAQLSQLSELGTEIEELNAKYSDGSLTGKAQQAVKDAINDKLEEFDAKYKEFGQDIEFSDRGDKAVDLDEEVKETEEVKIDREAFSEEDKTAVADLEEQLKTAVADKDTKKVQEVTNSIIEIENKYRDADVTEETAEAPVEEAPVEETPKAEEPAVEKVAEEPAQEVDTEAVAVEENTIADAEFRIEDLNEEINIEKGNIKEAKEKAKEDTAAVRKSKLSKEEKAEKIEEIKAELQDNIDEINGNIGIYKEDINALKSDIRKSNKRIAKLTAVTKVKAPDVAKVKTPTEATVTKKLQAADQSVKKFGDTFTSVVENFGNLVAKLGGESVPIYVVDEATYKESTGKDSRGSFTTVDGKKAILVNADKATLGTVYHEMMHAYISSMKIPPKQTVSLANTLKSELRKGNAKEKQLANRLDAFQKEYIEREIYGKGLTMDDPNIAEEFLSEFVGQIKDGIDVNNMSLSTIDKIRLAVAKFINNILNDKIDTSPIQSRQEAFDFIENFLGALEGRTEVTAKANPERSAIINSKNPYQASRFQIEVPVGSRIANEPLKDARSIAISYMESKGLKHTDGKLITKLDEKLAKGISDAYIAMKNNPKDAEVAAAYKAMAEETLDQHEAIIKAGYKVEVNNNEPYNNSNELIEDLRKNKNMRIFSTDSGFGDEGITAQQRKDNPMLAETKYKDTNGRTLLVNDIFRFVHDFFGHAERGNGFGPIGEENAWDVHSRMFSPLARKALTAETRGQNSYVNFSGVNDEAFKIRDKGRALRKEGKFEEAKEFTDKAYSIMKYAPQKVGLLPDEFVENPYLEEKVEKAEPIVKEQIDAVEIISSETPRQKAKKEAVAEMLNGFADTQLPPNSSEQDLISRFLNNIFEESLYTLKKGPRESGMTWYIEDITEFENKMTVLLPELSDPNQMKLFKQVLAITSSGTNPNQNLQTAYTLWVRSNGNAVNFAKNWGEDKISFITKKGQAIGTGIIVRETKTKYVVQKVDALGNPEVFKNGTPKLFEAKKSDLKDGYPKPAGFTARGNIVAQQLTKIEKVYEAVGKDINKLIEFFENPQPVSELRKYNKGVPDIDGNVRKVAVGKRNGAFIFGEKIGAFYQNMIGIGDTITMDLWWSRTWNRYMGTMLSTVDNKKVIQETPRTDRERDVMRKAVTLAAKKLNLNVSELQAVIWYFEQDLWTKAGNVSPSFSYVTATDALNSKIKTDEQTQKRFSEAGADLTAAEKRRQDAIARANNIIAEGGIQGTVKEQIDWESSEFGRGQVNPAIVNRTTPVQEAASDLLQGKITNAEYQEIVRITQPIEAITKFYLPASSKDMLEALDSNKGKLLNVELEDGTIVGLRLDIPAYKNRNIWIVSVHRKGASGKSLTYGSVAWATNVQFGSNPKIAAFIAAGKNMDTLEKQNKSTIARMHGEWKNFEGKTKEEKDAAAVKKVEEIVAIENSFPGAGRKGSPWRQIGMNPFRHSYFYDRRNGKPVVGASEVVQIGGLVYAKDVLYADRNDMTFEVSGYKDANGDPVRFQLELDDMDIQPSVYKKNIFQKIASQFVWTNIEKQARILFESKEGQVTLAVKNAREISRNLRRLAKDTETLDMISDYMEGVNRSDITDKLSKTDKGRRILDLLSDADAMVESFADQIVDDPAFESLAIELKFAITNNAGTYLKTRYRFFTDKKYKIKDKARAKAIQAERDMIVARQLAVLKKAGLSEEEIDQTIQDSLSDIDKQAHESIDLYINKLENIKQAPSVTGADIRIPSSSFQMKKDIPYHIQELLGVEKDPVSRFSATIQAQANILYKGRMVQGLLDMSKGAWGDYILDSEPEPAKAPLYKFVKDPYSPLNGKYVHEEIMNIFDRKPLYESDKAWVQGYFSLLKLGRKSKVIWNIPTWRKNLTGGWYFMLANGVLANPRMYKDLKDRLALTVNSEMIMTDPQTKAWLEVMGKKGLLGANVDAQLIGINDAAYQYMYDGDDKAYKRAFKKVYSSLSNADKFLQEKYSAVDDYTKLVIFRQEVESFAMKIYGKEYESLNEAQKDRVHDDAAEFVKQNTPTFSRLPKFYDKLAVIPILGDFVSFQFESIRSMSSNILNGVEDMKIAINGVDKNGNKLSEEQTKAYKASAGKRLVGTLSALALKYAMVEGFQQLFLDDDDEELAEDAKRVSPEWMKGQSLIVKSIKKNGDVRVYNYSSEDPYGTVGDLTSPAGWGSLVNTFVRPNIAADYIFRAVKGEDIYGRKLFDKSDTAVENALAFLGYTAKTFIVPPFISSSYRDVVSKNEKNAIDLFTDGETAKDLALTIAERSFMRDYQYNILDQFRYSVKDIASNKPLKDAGNVDKRYRHLESVREDFYAIKRIAIAKGNIKLAKDAQIIINRNFDKEERRFILRNIKSR